ncbi:YARHG domain-containing protein [Armatimonas sp.]|uniref:YARHG domain-containing protein n=1 Tax=Armatimonas sp. TaxID=1872638 RepID=UPI003752F6EE
MKKCPECSREYLSELLFCKEDGAELVVINSELVEGRCKGVRPSFMADLPDPEVLEREDPRVAKHWLSGKQIALCAFLVVVGVSTAIVRSWQLRELDKKNAVQVADSTPQVTASTPNVKVPTIKPSSTPVQVAPGAYPGERFPQTRTSLLTQVEISTWDFAAVRYAINEIYARHGYAFKDPDIRRRFETFRWYKAERGMTMERLESSRLSRTELANAKLLADRRALLDGE